MEMKKIFAIFLSLAILISLIQIVFAETDIDLNTDINGNDMDGIESGENDGTGMINMDDSSNGVDDGGDQDVGIEQEIQQIAPNLDPRIRGKIVRAITRRVKAEVLKEIKGELIKRKPIMEMVRGKEKQKEFLKRVKNQREILKKEWKGHKKAIDVYKTARNRWSTIQKKCRNNETDQQECFEAAKDFSLKTTKLLIKRLEMLKEKIRNNETLDEINDKLDALNSIKESIETAETMDDLRDTVKAANELAKGINEFFRELYLSQIIFHFSFINMHLNRTMEFIENRLDRLEEEGKDISELKDDVELIKEKIRDVEEKINNLKERYESEEVDKEVIKEEIKTIKEEIEELGRLVKEHLKKEDYKRLKVWLKEGIKKNKWDKGGGGEE